MVTARNPTGAMSAPPGESGLGSEGVGFPVDAVVEVTIDVGVAADCLEPAEPQPTSIREATTTVAASGERTGAPRVTAAGQERRRAQESL